VAEQPDVAGAALHAVEEYDDRVSFKVASSIVLKKPRLMLD
jgi:hypothetical protein